MEPVFHGSDSSGIEPSACPKLAQGPSIRPTRHHNTDPKAWDADSLQPFILDWPLLLLLLLLCTPNVAAQGARLPVGAAGKQRWSFRTRLTDQSR